MKTTEEVEKAISKLKEILEYYDTRFVRDGCQESKHPIAILVRETLEILGS